VKYPLKFTVQNQSNYATRSSSEASRLKVAAKTKRACSSFMGDCPKIWNAAPVGEIKETGKTKMSQASFIGDSSWVWNKAPTFMKGLLLITAQKSSKPLDSKKG
jgi:hypothetical protein